MKFAIPRFKAVVQLTDFADRILKDHPIETGGPVNELFTLPLADMYCAGGAAPGITVTSVSLAMMSHVGWRVI